MQREFSIKFPVEKTFNWFRVASTCLFMFSELIIFTTAILKFEQWLLFYSVVHTEEDMIIS